MNALYLDLARELWVGAYALAKRTHWRRSPVFDGEREFNLWGEDGDGHGAAVDNLGPARYVSAYRPLRVHTDPDSEKWSHFLLLRTKQSTVWAEDGTLPFMQVPGAFMRVNVHAPHSLVRSHEYPMWWCAAIIDCPEPLPEIEAIRQFRVMSGGLYDYARKRAA